MRLSTEQMQNIVDDLQGTCQSLDHACENECGFYPSEIENEMQLCDYVDNRLFTCVECGWWYENGDWWSENPDADNGDICSSCGECR